MEMVSEAGRSVERDPFYLSIFFLSLALIVTGVGFLKTNISTLVGALYEKGDPRRDSGFTLFYMGINIGGAAAPLLCGWLGQTYGWKYGFGLAGIGMLAGLIAFLRGQKYLEGHAESAHPERLAYQVMPGLTTERLIYLGTIPLVAIVWYFMTNQEMVGQLLSITGIVASIAILYYAIAKCTAKERSQLLVCATLIIFSLAFWALYEQMGSSLNLFADRVVDRVLFGYEIQASTLQSLPAIFVILLAPIFSMAWIGLSAKGLEPTTPVKFSMGIALVACAFFILVGGVEVAGDEKVALIFFILTFLFLVLGELCLSPISLSMVTKLAPKRIVAMMMGFLMLAWSASSFVAGQMAKLASIDSTAVDGQNISQMAQTYAGLYMQLGMIALIAAGVLYVISPILGRGMHEEEQGNPTLIARFYPSRFRE